MNENRGASPGGIEVVSGELSVELLKVELIHVVKELQGLGVKRVSVTHWMGKAEVPVSALIQAFQDGFDRQGGIHSEFSERLGLSDFYLSVDGVNTQFEFCHHCELHVISDNELLLERFESRWQSLGYKFTRR